MRGGLAGDEVVAIVAHAVVGGLAGARETRGIDARTVCCGARRGSHRASPGNVGELEVSGDAIAADTRKLERVWGERGLFIYRETMEGEEKWNDSSSAL